MNSQKGLEFLSGDEQYIISLLVEKLLSTVGFRIQKRGSRNFLFFVIISLDLLNDYLFILGIILPILLLVTIFIILRVWSNCFSRRFTS